MNELLEKELKNLSIKSLNDLVDLFKQSKKKLFSSSMKYDKNFFVESDIKSVAELKRWLTNLTKKSKDRIKLSINEFMFYYRNVETILESRINELNDSLDRDYLNELNNKCDTYFTIIKLMGDDEDYIDRMGLSNYLYEIKTSNNVEVINNSLEAIITKLNKIDIKLDVNNFSYIIPVKDYMNEYFKSSSNPEFNKLVNTSLKEYKTIYSNFNYYLYLSLLNILNKKKSEILKYLNRSIINKLENVQSNKLDIFNKYLKVRKEYINLLGNDNKTILEYFKNNKSKMSLYELNNKTIMKIISSISNLNVYKKYSLEDRIFYNNNLIEFYWDLDEYKFVCDYKHLFDYVESIKKQEFNIKDYNKLLKVISILNKRIIKTNKELYKNEKKLSKVLVMESNTFYSLQEKCQKISSNLNELVEELIEALDNYDEIKLSKNIHEIINDKSTVHDVLKILNNNYNVLVKLYPLDIEKIRDMEYFHHLSLLDNIYYDHISSIKYLIEQKYNLYNISINIPNVDSKEYDNLKDNLSILIRYLTLLNKNISIEDIKIILSSMKD